MSTDIIHSNSNVDESKQVCCTSVQTSPNSMFLSILHILWIWLRPTLPEPLTYRRGSKKLYSIVKLVQMIKKQEELHTRFYNNYKEAVCKAVDYTIHLNTYIYPATTHNIHHYMNEAKCYRNMVEEENHKRNKLKIRKNFIVSVLGPLLECCSGVQNSLM